MVVVLPSDTTLKICRAECHEVNVDGWKVFHNVLVLARLGQRECRFRFAEPAVTA